MQQDGPISGTGVVQGGAPGGQQAPGITLCQAGSFSFNGLARYLCIGKCEKMMPENQHLENAQICEMHPAIPLEPGISGCARYLLLVSDFSYFVL